MFLINLLATSIKAYLGQLGNQSSEQQFINEGNFRQRTRSCYPTGLMQSITWRFYRIELMKQFHNG